MTVDRVAGLTLGLIGLVVVVESRAFPLGSLHRPGPAFTWAAARLTGVITACAWPPRMAFIIGPPPVVGRWRILMPAPLMNISIGMCAAP